MHDTTTTRTRARTATSSRIGRNLARYGVQHMLDMADEQIAFHRGRAAEFAHQAIITAGHQTELRASYLWDAQHAEGCAEAWEAFAAEYAGAGLEAPAWPRCATCGEQVEDDGAHTADTGHHPRDAAARTQLFRIHFALGTDHFGRRLETSTAQRAATKEEAVAACVARLNIPRGAVTGVGLE